MEIDTIYNMDCLEGMKMIPDGSVDCIICDLPYGTTACAWDSIIPFDKLWAEYKRIRKPNAPIVLFGAEPFSSALRMSNMKEYRYDWYWYKYKGSGFQNANKQPMRVIETISVFYAHQPTYNPQMRKGFTPYKTKDGFRKTTIRSLSDRQVEEKDLSKLESRASIASFYRIGKEYGDERFPYSMLAFEKEAKVFHPTQKPVNLLRYLIATYSNEGDTILDNCMGSGTTAIASIREKRHFIGFELNAEYYEKAMKRIKLERQQLTLF